MAASDSNADIYNATYEHSQEDIELVKKWADEEQQRRIEDILGETQRRSAANQASEIFSSSLRPTWFQKGSSYVLRLMSVAREARDGMLNADRVRLLSASFQTFKQNAAQGVKDQLGGVGLKAQEKAEGVKLLATEKAQDVKLKAQETAADVKLKIKEKLDTAQAAGKDTIGKVQTAGKERIEKVQTVGKESLEKVQVAGKEGLEVVQVKVQRAARLIRQTSQKLLEKVNKSLSRFSSNSSLAFAILEEENERTWRLSSETEIYAIINALKVSALIKELSPALYRPEFEPSSLYGTKLLEEAERARRVLSDKTAINNAKVVACLVEAKFTRAPIAIPAKAEHVEEIKVRPPIAPTM